MQDINNSALPLSLNSFYPNFQGFFPVLEKKSTIYNYVTGSAKTSQKLHSRTIHAQCLCSCFSGWHFANPVMSQLKEWHLRSYRGHQYN